MQVIRLSRTKESKLCYKGKEMNLAPLRSLRMIALPHCSKKGIDALIQFEAENFAKMLSSEHTQVFYDADLMETRDGGGIEIYAAGLQFYKQA